MNPIHWLIVWMLSLFVTIPIALLADKRLIQRNHPWLGYFSGFFMIVSLGVIALWTFKPLPACQQDLLLCDGNPYTILYFTGLVLLAVIGYSIVAIAKAFNHGLSLRKTNSKK